jgi:hypothetical protein
MKFSARRLSGCLLGLANQLPQFGNIIPGASKEGPGAEIAPPPAHLLEAPDGYLYQGGGCNQY